MFILLHWVKYYTKELTKALSIMLIALLIILTIAIIKYKPAYEVKVSGEELGFIESKENFELEINNYLNDTTGNIFFREIKNTPEYTLKFVNRDKKFDEEKILFAVENNIETTYKTYAILVDNTIKTSVSSEEEAKTVVENMKKNVNESLLDVGIIEQYTSSFDVQSQEEADKILTDIKKTKIAEYNAEQYRIRKVAAIAAAKAKSIENVGNIANLAIARPINNGTISSRFGSRGSNRASSHTGLDLAAPLGTTVTPIATGTVTFAGYQGSYGYLVIVDHGNGVESYYAHCSQIFVGVGQNVAQSTAISAVGSTGNSTGPHLHLEIRLNGVPLNPENYLY